MKKYISILLAAGMAVCCLSACGQNNSNTNTQAKDNNDKQVKVVTTVFPEYDWVKRLQEMKYLTWILRCFLTME